MIRLSMPLVWMMALSIAVCSGVQAQESEVPAEARASLTINDEGLPQLPPRAVFDEIVQRPLFSVSRRPMEPVVGDSSESALRETWRLTGIVLVDQQPQALFSERDGERRLRLADGMPLDSNWLVESIQPQIVMLNNGEQSVRMELFEPRDLPPQTEQPATDQAAGEQAPASIEERTQSAAQQLRERVEALKGGSQ